MEEALPERPDLHQTEDALRPLGPWAFLREAVAGGLGRWGLQLMAAWALLPVLGSAAWAQHLRAHAGNSALPNYWGEMLTARDAWELAVNGQLERAPLGFLPGLVLAVLLLWALWAGWKLQARTVELEGRLMPWLLGGLDALLLAALPLAACAWLLDRILDALAATGIQGLGWLDLVATPLVWLCAGSAFMVQWWICRIAREGEAPRGLGALGRHLGRAFLRCWLHPVEWGLLVLGGVVARTGLSFLVLRLAWAWGGGSSARVWLFLGLQVLAALLNAWLIGWMLRLSARYWRHDVRVRAEIRALRVRIPA